MRRFLASFSVSLAIWGCKTSKPDNILAQYGERYLTREEAMARVALPAEGDTLGLLRAYAMQWIRQQALAETAYKMLPSLSPQIEAQVQDYRDKLLIAHLSRLLIEKAPRVEVPDPLLEAVYQRQPEAFRALHAYFRWRWVQIPATWQMQWELRQKLTAPDSVWLAWLKGQGLRGAVEMNWQPDIDSLQPYFSVRLVDLPVQGTAQVQRTEEGRSYLLVFQLTGKILPGQIFPYTMVREQIRNIILQQNADRILAAFEEDVYKRASARADVRVY